MRTSEDSARAESCSFRRLGTKAGTGGTRVGRPSLRLASVVVATVLGALLPIAPKVAADDTLRPRVSAFVLVSPVGSARGRLVLTPPSGTGFNVFQTVPLAGTTLDGRIRVGFGGGARLELSPSHYLRIAPFVQVELIDAGVSSLLTDLGVSLLPRVPVHLGARDGALYLSIASGLSVGRITVLDGQAGALGFALQAGVGLSVSVSDGTDAFLEAGWERRQISSDVGSSRFEVVTNQAFVRVGVTL